MLDKSFPGWQIDEILVRLLGDEIPKELQLQNGNGISEPFIDPRNNTAVLARPPKHIRELVGEVQGEIRKASQGEC